MHYVEFMLENYAAVQEKVVDFTLVDSGSADRVLPDLRGLKIAFPLSAEEGYGVAVAPGSDLLEPLNRFLEDFRQSGELERILETHRPGKE